MTQSLFLGAYWDARRSNADECADQVSRFIEGMSAIDPLLGQWFERGRSRKEARTRQINDHDRESLRALLCKGQNRYDEGGGVIEELGYSLGGWNGADNEDEEASLSIHCGSYSERVGNSIALDLPVQSEVLSDLQKAVALLKVVAEIWQPRWAGIMSERAMRERNFDADQPFVDWMVYVPRVIQSASPLASVIPLEGLGSIVVVQTEPPRGDDPEELERIRQVESILAA
jgi:hypothetical protein